MWKLPFPESTVSLPLWILSFALVFGSYPLNLIFLIEKDQPSRQEMAWTDVSFERNNTVNGRGIEVLRRRVIPWVPGPELALFMSLNSHRYPGSWSF